MNASSDLHAALRKCAVKRNAAVLLAVLLSLLCAVSRPLHPRSGYERPQTVETSGARLPALP